MSASLALGAAAALAVVASLRSTTPTQGGSLNKGFIRFISDEDLKQQIYNGERDKDIVLAWPTLSDGWVFTMANLKAIESWMDEPDNEVIYKHVRQLVREAEAFFKAVQFPLKLYRGLVVHGGKGSIRQNLGRHWTVDPAIARYFAFGEHEGSSGSGMAHLDRPFVVSMIVDDPAAVDWQETLENFFTYTAGRGVDPGYIEKQITLNNYEKTSEVARDIKYRQMAMR